MSYRYETRVSEAEKLAKKLAKDVRGGEVFALIGELGSGKTTFTKHLAKALGIKANVTSPTFVIMQEYKLPLKGQTNYFYHLDLYRGHSEQDIQTLGLTEIWTQSNTITVIEWADKIKSHLPKNTIYIYFEPNEALN